ncbi:MAG: FG-GAP repeat domain-containing protein [Planctomycetota bacterium]
MKPFSVLLPIALLASATTAAAQFNYNAASLPAQTLFTDGVELADVDGDGDIDILFANRGGTGVGAYGAGTAAVQHLFLNNGSGVFTAAHAQLNTANFASGMVVAEDIDNDGDLDLLYARDSGWPTPGARPKVLMNNGSGVFADETGSRMPLGWNQTGFGIALGDVDNDGDLDVCITDGGTFSGVATQARLALNNGAGFFSDVTATNLPVDLYNAQDVVLLDADNDFDIDILLTGKGVSGKRSRLYVNNGSGVFSISTALDAVCSGNTYEADFGDLDGDGDFDAAVQSISGTNEGWARNVGTASAWTKTTFTGPAQDDNEMACFDYDSDGDLDVVVGSLGSAERIYSNNGTGVFTHVPGAIQLQSDATLDLGFADLNGDGRIDIVTGQGESGNFTNKVYLNAGAIDTLAPVFKLVETPAAIGGSATVFRARIQDAVSEDGHVPATMTYTWSTTGVGAGSGSGTAMHQGGGQFRAAVPTNGGTTSATVNWTATDHAGNVSVNGPVTVGTSGNAWTDLGFALAGTSGNPLLAGTGTLVPGSAGTLTLSNAAPSALTFMFVSLSSTPVPFKGGTLVPVPIVSTLPIFTSGAGDIPLAWGAWPAGLSGLDLYIQYAIQDAGAVLSVALSNAVRGDNP